MFTVMPKNSHSCKANILLAHWILHKIIKLILPWIISIWKKSWINARHNYNVTLWYQYCFHHPHSISNKDLYPIGTDQPNEITPGSPKLNMIIVLRICVNVVVVGKKHNWSHGHTWLKLMTEHQNTLLVTLTSLWLVSHDQ